MEEHLKYLALQMKLLQFWQPARMASFLLQEVIMLLLRYILHPVSGMPYMLEGHTDIIKSLVFTPDNKYLYSSSRDGSMLKWDLNTSESSPIASRY